jgi:hypothetical protein
MRVLALASIPALGGACADTGSGPTGPQVKIDVAALSLPGIDEACFGITVFNGVPGVQGTDTVWSNNNVCSVQYGNGQGDITYIGPCDAGVTGNNYIQLVLNSLSANGDELSETGSPADFVNPCADPGDCVLDFECLPNADVLVEFNLTVMRNAQQGFFDIVVNFEDIFCSAKLDSCYDVVAGGPATTQFQGTTYFIYAGGGKTGYAIYNPALFNDNGGWQLYEFLNEVLEPTVTIEGGPDKPPARIGGLLLQNGSATGRPITLLHGDDGREHTAVAAVACTAGAGETTDILLSAPTVKCDNGVSFTIDLENEEGGNGQAYFPAGSTAATATKTLDFATYFGAEALQCDNESCGKVYYNIAFNLQALDDQDLTNCRLFYGATAVEKPAAYTASTRFNSFGRLSDRNGVYPAISFGGNNGISLTAETGEALCFAHGLNNDGSLVQTGYIRGGAFGEGEQPKADFHSNGTQAIAFDADVP